MNDYIYDAVVRAVHDGDSITCDVDLGFNNWIHGMKLRLYGLNAPELVTPGGKQAKAFLAQILPLGTSVVIETIKDKTEKYGRMLATIYCKVPPVEVKMNSPWAGLALPPIQSDGTINVNELLIKSGYAKIYFGIGPKPV